MTNTKADTPKMKWHLSVPAVMLLLAACEPAPDKAVATDAPPPAVVVTAVESRDIRPLRTFTGRIEAIDSVDLRARVQGFLEQRLFEEGRQVAPGDLLFVIEKASYEAEVDKAKAAIMRAEGTLKLATLDRERQATLVERKAVAQAKLDDALAKETEARGDLLREQAALKEAELNLSYTEIHAPIGGRIGRSDYSIGDFVGPDSDALAAVVSQDPMYVTFPVDQPTILAARKAAGGARRDPRAFEISVRLADSSLYDQTGTINFVDVSVDPTTDTVAVRGDLPNPDGLLIDGQLVTVEVRTQDAERKLVVPQQALQIDQAGRYVLIVDDEEKVEVRRVQTAGVHDGLLVIDDGLKEGERVIVEGLQKVRPGAQVKASEAPAAPQDTAS